MLVSRRRVAADDRGRAAASFADQIEGVAGVDGPGALSPAVDGRTRRRCGNGVSRLVLGGSLDHPPDQDDVELAAPSSLMLTIG